MFQELKCVSATIADINDLPICWQRLRSCDPQSTLSIFAIAFFRRRFVLGDNRATVKNLASQPKNFTIIRIHDQRIMTEPTTARAVSQLPGILQRRVAREIQFRRVMDDKNGSVMVSYLLQSEIPVLCQNTFMGHG